MEDIIFCSPVAECASRENYMTIPRLDSTAPVKQDPNPSCKILYNNVLLVVISV